MKVPTKFCTLTLPKARKTAFYARRDVVRAFVMRRGSADRRV